MLHYTSCLIIVSQVCRRHRRRHRRRRRRQRLLGNTIGYHLSSKSAHHSSMPLQSQSANSVEIPLPPQR